MPNEENYKEEAKRERVRALEEKIFKKEIVVDISKLFTLAM